MIDKLGKYSKYILLVLMALCVIFTIYTLIVGVNAVGVFMKFGYAIFGVTVLVALFSPIYGMIINPKNIKKIGIALGLAVIIGVIALIMSKGATLPTEYLEKVEISKGIESFVDWGMNYLYIVFGITILAVIYSAVAKLFN